MTTLLKQVGLKKLYQTEITEWAKNEFRLINKERWPITTLANNVDALTKNNNGKCSLSRPAFYRALLKKGLT